MDLILWRHAEAEALATTDSLRALTPKGRKQAKKMAIWLKQQMPKTSRIACFASEAVRSQQTLSAFTTEFAINAKLNPGVSAQDYLTIFESCQAQSDVRAVLIVGHQPEIGQLASRLLTGHEVPCEVKKGAIWWLQQRQEAAGEVRYQLRAMVTPQIVCG